MSDMMSGRSFSDDRIGEVARSLEPHDFERVAPPAQVWNNIVAEFEVEQASAEANARSAQRRHRLRWFSNTRLLSVAAALVILGGVLAAVTLTRDDSQPTELAVATMTDADLPVATDERAQARFLCEDDACWVDIELSGVPEAGDADLELWVINGDVTDMHSLGLVTESGSFPLPADVSADGFPIVDISVEPRDGVAAHSGQSVLRGIFESK